RDLGVRSGDLLMIHGSLRALGLARSQGVEKGAELVLSPLEEAVGPTGTLLMILGTDYAQDWVNERPVSERAALLAGTDPLVLSQAQVLGEVGWIAESFRRLPGTLTSDNPSGRFAARGARAGELLRDQPWNDYYGPGSPPRSSAPWAAPGLPLGPRSTPRPSPTYARTSRKAPTRRPSRGDPSLRRPQ